MAVYGLTRVSTADQVDGTSIAEQERKIRAVAALADLEIDRIFSDRGVSGGIPLAERPAGGELVVMLQPRDVIIGARLDRIFRSACDALNCIEAWREQGIDLIVSEFGPSAVTRDGTSKLLVGLLACVADFERGQIRERVISGRRAKLRAGGHAGGHVPFGYRKIGTGKAAMLEPIPEQQEAINRMEELQREGLSLRGIAARIKEEAGFTVSHIAVRNALARRAVGFALKS